MFVKLSIVNLLNHQVPNQTVIHPERHMYNASPSLFVNLTSVMQLCMCCLCMCRVLRMTSSNPRIYSRGVWETSDSSYATERRRCLPASFTYNNIQVHSPLPNTHTQTIHGTLNSISVRARLRTSVSACTCVFVCKRAEERPRFPKNMSSSVSTVR